MSIREWFQSWWWPSRVRELTHKADVLTRNYDIICEMQDKTNAAFRKAEAEAKRMREKWMAAARELENAKEQAVQQKQERRAIYEQRDEARMALKHFAQFWSQGKAAEFKMPEWFKDPHADLEARMKAGDA